MVVVVLGMHRSGTSLVAGLLHAMGVHMGDDLLKADENNPHGYYEDCKIVGLNEVILTLAGGTWAEPPEIEAIQTVGKDKRVADAIAYLVGQRAQRDAWGFKDPRTCLTAELWHPSLKDPRYVVVNRTRKAVVKSLMRRAKQAAEKARALIAMGGIVMPEWRPVLEHATWRAFAWGTLFNIYVGRRQMFLDAVDAPKLRVRYEDLMREPEPHVRRLAEFVGQEYRPELLDLIERGR